MNYYFKIIIRCRIECICVGSSVPDWKLGLSMCEESEKIIDFTRLIIYLVSASERQDVQRLELVYERIISCFLLGRRCFYQEMARVLLG